RGPSRASLAGTGPFPYHDAFESGGGSGAARRKHPLPGGEPAEGAAPQAPALAAAAPGQPHKKLDAPLARKRAAARAWELKETFFHFWGYRSVTWAGAFLDYWCYRALRSRLEPMKKVARMLRAHEELLLNWFRAKGEISNGAVEGLNNKLRVVTRRSYGFLTYNAMEIALYHTL